MRKLISAVILLCAGVPALAQFNRIAVVTQQQGTSQTVVASGQVYVCASQAASCGPGSTTQAIYSNSGLTTGITQPLVTDGSGNFNYWVACGDYTEGWYDSSGNFIGLVHALDGPSATFSASGQLLASCGSASASSLTGVVPIANGGTNASTAATALSNLGAVPATTTVNGHALSGNVTVSASDLTTGTLPHAQLPALLSGDIPANAASTSGNAATATALAATPSLCSTGQAPTGITANGNATGCASISGGGNTTNALTMDNSNSGAASGSTFNGSAAVKISRNTIGAAASGANSDITSLSGLTTPVSAAQGGTGSTSLANSLNNSQGILQSVNAGMSPVWGFNCFGDSIFNAYQLQGSGGIGDVSACSQMATDWGVPAPLFNNYGYQSYNGADLAWKIANLVIPSESENPLAVILIGTNETDTGTANTTNQNLGYEQELIGMDTYLATGPSERTMAYASATLTGSYATDSTSFTVAKGVKTATTGTATIAVNVGASGTLVCWVYQYTTSTGVFQMLDVTTPANTVLTDVTTGLTSFASQGIARATSGSGSTFWFAGLRFTGLQQGYHKIEQNVTTSGPTGLIGCTSPAGRKSGVGAPAVVQSNVPPEQYGTYSAAIAATNAYVTAAWAVLKADGYNVAPWDVFSDLNTSTDFDSKSVIGFTVGSVGSGQTNGTYNEIASSYTCGGTSGPYINYTIAGGVLTGIPTVSNNPAANFTSAFNCTAATFTIAHGGTPATVTAVLSSNANYSAAPPYHPSGLGQLHIAQSAEKVVQAAINNPTQYNCQATGAQTLNGQCHELDIATAGVITLPTNVSSPSLATQGIVPGMCWDIVNGSTGSITFTGGNGGTAALSSSQFVIPKANVNSFGGAQPSAARICLQDTTGIYNVVSSTPNVVTPYINQSTFAAGAAAGTSPGTPACKTSSSCNYASGTISFTVGTATTTGILLTVTLPTTSGYNRSCTGAAYLAASPYTALPLRITGTTTTAVFNVGIAPTASTAYELTYVCSPEVGN